MKITLLTYPPDLLICFYLWSLFSNLQKEKLSLMIPKMLSTYCHQSSKVPDGVIGVRKNIKSPPLWGYSG